MLAHVDMDAFYAAVEILDRPALAGRPVIVGSGKRGVVSAASYAARAHGVRSAMPLFQARRLCPQGVFVPVRMERYRQMSRQVMQVLAGFSPVLEQVSVDEAYLDLAGTEGLWGQPQAAGRAIKQAMRDQTGLTCSVGLAPLRFLAKIASERDKPDGLCVVGDLEEFLATVSLAEVPGVGKKARARLGELGLTQLVQVRVLGRERLEAMMGALGRRLWDLARGVEPTGVRPSREVKSISHELTLDEDTGDRELLAGVLLGLSQKVCRRLRAQGLQARGVTLKLRHADLRLVTRSVTLPAPTDQAGQMFAAARELLDNYRHPGPFRLIGVGGGSLESGQGGQIDLFAPQGTAKGQALARAEDDICRRFGEKALTRAGALDPGSKDGHNEP